MIPTDASVSAPTAELPRPLVSDDAVQQLLADRFGIVGARLRELGSQQDRNFRVDDGHGRRLVLKIANPGWPRESLDAQDAVLHHLGDRLPYAVPLPVAEPTTMDVDGVPHVVRLLTYVEGTPLGEWDYLAPRSVAGLGRVAAEMVLALHDFSHPGLDRWVQWDLRRTREVVDELLPRVSDRELRARVAAATDEACARLDALADQLPLVVVHGDLTDDNVVARESSDGRPVPAGVIDFGDLAYGWRGAELAVAAGCALHHADATPMSVVPAVREFHSRVPLTEAELDALWPMVLARSAVLLVSGHAQLAIDPHNAYAASGSVRERAMFELALAIPCEVATAAIRASLALPVRATVPRPAGPVLDLRKARILDLSTTSPALDAGLWTAPDCESRLLAPTSAHDAVVTRHGEARLTRAGSPALSPPEVVALGVTAVLGADAPVLAPWRGEVTVDGGRLRLAGRDTTVLLRGVVGATPGHVDAGDSLGVLPAGVPLHLQLSTLPEVEVPEFTTAALAAGWTVVCPDPSGLLGLPPRALAASGGPTAAEVMAARQAVVPEAQERYYGEHPPQFERGWRDLMVDVDARPYVDTVNNVTMVGHGHPRVAAAAARQWLLLNTNSRFLYRSLAEYSSQLAALFPDELDTVFLVNSGSEAVDLALRLAKVHTGHRDVVAISEAYHGWTEASDAVSTSLHDNPRADVTRPDWVHTVLVPNTYRGVHQGPAAGDAYVADVRTAIHELAAAGRAPAAFICEAMYGKEGALALPRGYLAAAYTAVRAHGGLAIADEVQVGFGRLGEHLWGYEQQGVVPDVVTMAKAQGNGQPLGAVVTRRAVAESFAHEGTFFSSAGGSPVSCAVGAAVLDVWRDERLQENARDVGRYFRSRIDELASQLSRGQLAAAATHGLHVGAVHGLGLYQGVELVRDPGTREPATDEALALCERGLDLGVILQPTGENFNILKVKPPMCLSRESVDHVMAALVHALDSGW